MHDACMSVHKAECGMCRRVEDASFARAQYIATACAAHIVFLFGDRGVLGNLVLLLTRHGPDLLALLLCLICAEPPTPHVLLILPLLRLLELVGVALDRHARCQVLSGQLLFLNLILEHRRSALLLASGGSGDVSRSLLIPLSAHLLSVGAQGVASAAVLLAGHPSIVLALSHGRLARRLL